MVKGINYQYREKCLPRQTGGRAVEASQCRLFDSTKLKLTSSQNISGNCAVHVCVDQSAVGACTKCIIIIVLLVVIIIITTTTTTARQSIVLF